MVKAEHPYRGYPQTYDFENARIMWPNFGGVKSEFNREGKRQFSLRLAPEGPVCAINTPQGEQPLTVEDLLAHGLRLRRLKPTYEGENPDWTLDVELRYSKEFPKFDPKVIFITRDASGNQKHSRLDEGLVYLVDESEILYADVTIRIHNWGPIQGDFGRKAHLREAAIEVYQNLVARKYDSVFEEGQSEAVTF
jgi:hypothetical protein